MAAINIAPSAATAATLRMPYVPVTTMGKIMGLTGPISQYSKGQEITRSDAKTLADQNYRYDVLNSSFDLRTAATDRLKSGTSLYGDENSDIDTLIKQIKAKEDILNYMDKVNAPQAAKQKMEDELSLFKQKADYAAGLKQSSDKDLKMAAAAQARKELSKPAVAGTGWFGIGGTDAYTPTDEEINNRAAEIYLKAKQNKSSLSDIMDAL